MILAALLTIAMAPQDLMLWYRQPAQGWTSALPVGNGRIGAMSFGGVEEERILLNEDTIWAGPPHPVQPADSAKYIAEARKLLFEGKNAEAQDLLQKNVMAEHEGRRSYQPFGYLDIRMGSNNDRERSLSLKSWRRFDGALTPEMSLPDFDDSLWVSENLEVAHKGSLIFRTTFDAAHPNSFNLLQLSPIDDEAQIYLNGKLIGETKDWSKPHTLRFDQPLRVGRNVLVAVVRNNGGAGHMAKSVVLDSQRVPADYRHELDLDSAVATTSYTQNGVRYRREVFVSPVDQVAVVRIEASRKGSLAFIASLNREFGADVRVRKGHLELVGRAGYPSSGTNQTVNENLGTRFHGIATIVSDGIQGETDLRVTGATTATILIAIATDYNRSDPAKPLPGNLRNAAQSTLDRVKLKPYAKLKADAVAAHRTLFRRVSLDLGDNVDEPTDARLNKVKSGATDPALEELYFQFGRYLLITSSRPGDMPANLQGVWNPHMAAPWNADYHTNINLQMNYWIAEVGNLSECHTPLFDLMENMRPSMRRLATTLGSQGVALGHTTDNNYYAALSGNTVWGLWPHGAGWTSSHFMEHFRFTGDRKFLRERAHPFLKECAAFYLGWLVVDPASGKWVSGPSTSPENTYRHQGRNLNVSMGNAMDQEIVWEVFDNFLSASRELNIEDEFVAKVRLVQANLLMPNIGSDGRLIEWSKQYDEAEPGHRHLSHLYGVHPSHQFTHSTSPTMMSAARKSMEYRLSHGGGHTGWSRAWIINFYARFLDAEKAHENVRLLLAKSTLPNLWDDHPPFQIDGNFGGAAGMAEMLIQSHEGVVRLLPALPKAWPTGSFNGLVARGGFEFQATWKDGEIKSASVLSKLGGKLRLKVDAQEAKIIQGSRVERIAPEGGTFVIDTQKGKRYQLDFRQE